MVKLGIYPEDWAGDVSNDGGDFGERPVSAGKVMGLSQAQPILTRATLCWFQAVGLRPFGLEMVAVRYADLRTALSTSVLPSDQIAPGTLWLEAMTESNAVSIQLQSSSVMVSGGNSLMVWLPWPETCVRIL